jgi:hypothetical protein
MAGLFYIINSKKRESSKERILLYGFAGFFFSLTIYRVLYYIAEIMIQGTFRNNVMYGEFRDESPIFVKIIIISYIVAFMIYFLSMEIILKRKKMKIRPHFIITIINNIFIILIIISPLEVARLILAFIFYPFILLMLFLNIFYITKWSKFEFKAISSFLFLGLCLILGGISLTDPLAKSMNALPLFLSPLLVIVGTIVAISPLLISPEILSQTKTIWKISGILIISIFLLFLVYIIIFKFPISVIILIAFVNLMSCIVVLKILKMIKDESSCDMMTKNKKNELNIMLALTKPMKVTEEEVIVSKEKKICIVCKGNLVRKIYLCPECNTFYCTKCSSSLSFTENACWVCGTAFNPLKPVKLYHDKEKKSQLDRNDLHK